MKTFATGLLVTAALLSAEASFAQAPQQWRPERPNPGVYGTGTEQSSQVLTLDGSAGTGYDTNPQQGAAEAGFGTPGSLAPSQGSMYNQFSGGLSYSAAQAKWSLGASVFASARQYPQADTPMTMGQSASVGASGQLGNRTTIHGGGSATFSRMRNFSPFAQLGEPLLGQTAAPNLDFAYGNTNYLTGSVDAGITHQLSSRSDLAAFYSRSSSAFDTDFQDITHQTGSFRFTHGLSRNLRVRLGYGYTEALYGINQRRYQTHNFDTGVDYGRALSLSRRTTLAFSTGATAVQQSEQTHFDVIGAATLNREVGRTWNASLAYSRSVGYTAYILEPIFSDSISAAYGGLINRRLSFHSGVATSRGGVGFRGGSANGFDAFNANAGLSQALTRHFAVNLNYSLYRYNFEPGAALLTGLVPWMNRHSINVTLSAWTPIFQHGRKTNASR